MSNILLVNMVIREFAPPNNVPLGPCYIASYLEQYGHQVNICDLNGLRWIDKRREYWLDKYVKKYDYVGLSGLIVTAKEQRRVLDFLYEIKGELGDPVFISGGGLATSVPDFTFQYLPELDIAAIGEGEQTMLEIADGVEWEDIDGIWWKDAFGKIHKNKAREFIPDLDILPYPVWDKVPVDEVYLGNPIWGGDAGNSSKINYAAKCSMNMVVSRGCPMRCRFCYHDIWGKKYRLRSVYDVVDEIRELKERYDIDFVGFVDDNTTANRHWTVQFCAELIAAKLDVHWGCSARVDSVDFTMLKTMKAAGCEWVGFGIESGSQAILDAMNKRITPDMAARAIQMVRDADMWANTTYIIGYPGETEKTFKETNNFMIDNDAVNSIFFATAYPGTELYYQVKPQIIEQFGSEKEYILSLGDATQLVMNYSEIPTERLIELREMTMRGGRL